MNREYYSNFAGHIAQFIRQKHDLGFPYVYSEYVLATFDKFCVDRFPHEALLTKEIGQAWAIRKECEGVSAFRCRMAPIRELAAYLRRLGLESYIIPTDDLPKQQAKVPHIFSQDELRLFFNVLDNTPYDKRFPTRHLVIPVYFRLLYCCGLRPSEPRNLQVEDVDLADGHISIRESKGHKDRVVMLHDDLLSLCQRYNAQVSRIFPGRKWFFPNAHAEKLSLGWACHVFQSMLAKTEIQQVGSNPPVVYSLRHTFATHRLYLWMQEGKDLMAWLPYLSTYMGHTEFSTTAYYIHLIPGMFEKMAHFNINQYEHLLPEVVL